MKKSDVSVSSADVGWVNDSLFCPRGDGESPMARNLNKALLLPIRFGDLNKIKYLIISLVGDQVLVHSLETFLDLDSIAPQSVVRHFCIYHISDADHFKVVLDVVALHKI